VLATLAPMPRNIENKAYVESIDALAPKAAGLATEDPIQIAQDDTFFRCDSGRLNVHRSLKSTCFAPSRLRKDSSFSIAERISVGRRSPST
jgi:hypothetical protein